MSYGTIPLKEILSEYSERNKESKYVPVAIGKYGIRTRESIYSKDLTKDYSKNKLIYNNTLTVGMGSTQMDIGILSDDIIYSVSPAYHTYKIKNINPVYLRYCLEHRNQDMFLRYVKRGSRQGKSIDLKRWLNYEIPTYSKEIQESIVTKLQLVDKVIYLTRKHMMYFDVLVKSRFIEMFGGIKELREVADVCSDIVDCPHSTPKYDGDNKIYPCIRTSEIKNGNIVWESMKYVSIDEYNVRTKRLLPKAGDIVYAREGSYGDCIVIPEHTEMCLGQRTMLFRPNYSICNSTYLCFILRSDDVKRQADYLNTGSTVPHVNVADAKKFSIKVPPLELQNQFADFVAQVDKSKLAVQQSLNELETLKKSLMQQYFG